MNIFKYIHIIYIYVNAFVYIWITFVYKYVCTHAYVGIIYAHIETLRDGNLKWHQESLLEFTFENPFPRCQEPFSSVLQKCVAVVVAILCCSGAISLPRVLIVRLAANRRMIQRNCIYTYKYVVFHTWYECVCVCVCVGICVRQSVLLFPSPPNLNPSLFVSQCICIYIHTQCIYIYIHTRIDIHIKIKIWLYTNSCVL